MHYAGVTDLDRIGNIIMPSTVKYLNIQISVINVCPWATHNTNYYILTYPDFRFTLSEQQVAVLRASYS